MSNERHVNKIPTIRGTDIMRDSHLNKGLAFTLEERQILGIHGLLPPCVISQEIQAQRVYRELQRKPNDLEKYIQLMALLERNESLFFRVLFDYTEELMPIVYTPTVGLACRKYGMIFRRPRGLFISIHDKGHIRDIVSNWPTTEVKAIVMTDGERILGLGDLGCCGMGIPVGKLALYTVCGGIDPEGCLPVMIDVGTNNEELLDDPFYIGVRQKRCNTEDYDELIDEFIQAALQRSVLKDEKAAIGIANLLVLAMKKEGLTEEQAKKKIWLVDSRGLVVKDRDCGGLTEQKLAFAKEHEYIDNLTDVVKHIKPTTIVGVAAVPGAFTEEICRDMASFNDRPVIFALSNPTSKAECTALNCYTWTE
ncbi:predicted protein, partial [Nematostella vectensis]